MSEDAHNVTTDHLEFPIITAAVPPGGTPAPAKPSKAVSKLYYVSEGVEDDVDGLNYTHFYIVKGSEEGFRTKEELAKFAKTLPIGEYTVLTASTKKIVISDVRRVKGV